MVSAPLSFLYPFHPSLELVADSGFARGVVNLLFDIFFAGKLLENEKTGRGRPLDPPL